MTEPVLSLPKGLTPQDGAHALAPEAVGVDVSHKMCYHRTDVDTQLSKFVAVWRPLLARLTGDLCRSSPVPRARFRANGSHQLTQADPRLRRSSKGLGATEASFWFAEGFGPSRRGRLSSNRSGARFKIIQDAKNDCYVDYL